MHLLNTAVRLIARLLYHGVLHLSIGFLKKVEKIRKKLIGFLGGMFFTFDERKIDLERPKEILILLMQNRGAIIWIFPRFWGEKLF